MNDIEKELLEQYDLKVYKVKKEGELFYVKPTKV